MLTSFRARLVTLYAILTSLALIGFSVAIFIAVRYQSYAELEQSLLVRASHIIEQIDFRDGKLLLPPSMTRDSAMEIKYDVLIDENGKPFFKSAAIGDKEIIVNKIDLKSIGYTPRLVDTHLSNDVPVKMAIIRTKHIPGRSYFITANPVAEVERRLENLGLTMIVGNVVFALLVFGIGDFFVRRALKPVREITKLAKDISRGDLSKRVSLPGPADELKELADTFDEMIARLEDMFESQKLFFQDVSHSLRTPLTIIRGKVDVALRSNNATVDDLTGALSDVQREAVLAAGLVNDLLAVARGEKIVDDLRKIEFPIDRMVVEIGARVVALGRQKGLDVRIDVPDTTILIVGDEQRLGEALLAIGENAIKYGRQGDSLSIRLSVKDESAVVMIKDTGPGISEEDIPFIFERFYRSQAGNKLSRGSGLGLTIAKRIIEAHNATLELVYSDDTGTEFEIRLPISAN